MLAFSGNPEASRQQTQVNACRNPPDPLPWLLRGLSPPFWANGAGGGQRPPGPFAWRSGSGPGSYTPARHSGTPRARAGSARIELATVCLGGSRTSLVLRAAEQVAPSQCGRYHDIPAMETRDGVEPSNRSGFAGRRPPSENRAMGSTAGPGRRALTGLPAQSRTGAARLRRPGGRVRCQGGCAAVSVVSEAGVEPAQPRRRPGYGRDFSPHELALGVPGGYRPRSRPVHGRVPRFSDQAPVPSGGAAPPASPVWAERSAGELTGLISARPGRRHRRSPRGIAGRRMTRHVGPSHRVAPPQRHPDASSATLPTA
jgi:hypothetical protein